MTEPLFDDRWVGTPGEQPRGVGVPQVVYPDMDSQLGSLGLGDLVEPGERPGAFLQILVARRLVRRDPP